MLVRSVTVVSHEEIIHWLTIGHHSSRLTTQFQLQSWHYPSHSVIRGIKRKICLTTTFLREIPFSTDYDRCDRIEKWQIHFYHRNNNFFWVTYCEKLKERKYIIYIYIYKKLVLKLYKSKIMANYHTLICIIITY